jgi:hypothetical protein
LKSSLAKASGNSAIMSLRAGGTAVTDGSIASFACPKQY